MNVATRLQTLSDTRIAIVSDNSVTMARLSLGSHASPQRGTLIKCSSTAGEIENQLCQYILATVLHSAKRWAQVP